MAGRERDNSERTEGFFFKMNDGTYHPVKGGPIISEIPGKPGVFKINSGLADTLPPDLEPYLKAGRIRPASVTFVKNLKNRSGETDAH